MFHLRIMVRQLLARAQIGGGNRDKGSGDGDKEKTSSGVEDRGKSDKPDTEWEDTLLRLSLKLASRLNVACELCISR
jgi:hypothetical protein